MDLYTAITCVLFFWYAESGYGVTDLYGEGVIFADVYFEIVNVNYLQLASSALFECVKLSRLLLVVVTATCDNDNHCTICWLLLLLSVGTNEH